MKRISNIVLTLILLLIFALQIEASAGSSDNENEIDYATGLIWDLHEDIDNHLLEELPIEEALPQSVDLKDTFPTPRNQGKQNSCVTWAVAYALGSHYEGLKYEWSLDTDSHLLSPAYVYNQINHGDDNGAAIISAMELMVKQGSCTLASFPYNQYDYTTQPTEKQQGEAYHYRAEQWYSVKGRDSIKRCLSEGDGVVIGIDIYSDFRNLNSSNTIFDIVSGIASGSHAVCLIGYDDAKNAFEFINSWGTDWGLDGYGWISYDLVDNAEVNRNGSSVGFVLKPRRNVFSEKYFDYTVSDSEATITKYFGRDNDVVIPDSIGGYPVKSIGDGAFQGCKTIENVNMASSVESIGYSAFAGCKALEKVDIPDSVSYVGRCAFDGCSSLAVVSIGSGVQDIGDSAFSYCGKLNNILVSKNNENYTDIDGVLFNKNAETLIKYPAAKRGKYTIPESVTEIGYEAFESCYYLTAVKIPDSVIKIDDYAFYACGLSDIIIPEGVAYIGDAAFMFCNLTSVTIPESVTYISNNAFHNFDIPYDIDTTIYCYENSYAQNYAANTEIPYEIIISETKLIDVSVLPNDENIVVNHITLTNTKDNLFNLTLNFDNAGDVLFYFASYEGNVLKRLYAGNDKSKISGINEQDLTNGKIYIWNKNMQPCIEVVSEIFE